MEGPAKENRVLALPRLLLRALSARPALFFFSSRRRHTRSKRDWSSDVCSSDLRRRRARRTPGASRAHVRCCRGRSEERRVGKECRSRGSPDHLKKKGSWRKG